MAVRDDAKSSGLMMPAKAMKPRRSFRLSMLANHSISDGNSESVRNWVEVRGGPAAGESGTEETLRSLMQIHPQRHCEQALVDRVKNTVGQGFE